MKGTYYLKVMAFALAITVFSCGKDDGPDTPDPVAQAPEITSFLPANGPVGTTVEINGKNFSATKTDNTVKFNGQVASVQLATTTKLTVTVPDGATDGTITVQVGDKTASSGSAFDVTEENTGPESITLSLTELTLHTLDADQLTITNLNEFENPEVVWNVDNADVLELDGQGNIVALQAGTATITVTIGELSAACQVTIEPTVFIAGYDGDNAVVWANQAKLFEYVPTTKTEVYAKSVCVEGKDVYVGGYEYDGDFSDLRGWKNNEAVLSVDNDYSRANAVVSNEGQIHFVGTGHDGSTYRAMAWDINGGETYLSEEGFSGIGEGAFSHGGSIYASGQQWMGNTATCQLYEVGGMAMDIGTPLFPYGSFGKAIYMDVTGEHIAGYDYNEGGKTVAKLWTNNGDTEVQFSNGTTNAKALAVHGNGEGLIVVGGTIINGVNEGWIWILESEYNVKLTEEGISGMVNGVYVHDGSIYAVGYEDHSQDEFIYTPMLWILDLQGNLVEEIQMTNSGASSEAYSVFVK